VDTVSGFIRTRVRIPPSPCIDRLVASEAARPPDGSGKRSSERRRLAGSEFALKRGSADENSGDGLTAPQRSNADGFEATASLGRAARAFCALWNAGDCGLMPLGSCLFLRPPLNLGSGEAGHAVLVQLRKRERREVGALRTGAAPWRRPTAASARLLAGLERAGLGSSPTPSRKHSSYGTDYAGRDSAATFFSVRVPSRPVLGCSLGVVPAGADAGRARRCCAGA
jgi:hypothetical protein